MSDNYGWSKGLNSFIDSRIKNKHNDFILCENSKVHRGFLRRKILNEN